MFFPKECSALKYNTAI